MMNEEQIRHLQNSLVQELLAMYPDKNIIGRNDVKENELGIVLLAQIAVIEKILLREEYHHER